MNTNRGDYVSKEDLRRIIQDSRYSERLMVNTGLPFGYPTVQSSPGESFDCVIEITDVESQGYYTGKIMMLASAVQPKQWVDASTFFSGLENQIRVTTMNLASDAPDSIGDKLVVGWRYACRVDARGSGGNPFPDEPIAYAMFVVPLGCGLKYREDATEPYIDVDLDQIAGYGLFVNTTGDCPVLDVNVAVLPNNVTVFDCGLNFNANSNTLSVDLSAVVGWGLSFANCSLDVVIDCGLTKSIDGLRLDTTTLVGDNCVTALIEGANPCEIAFDQVVDTTTTELEYGQVFLGVLGGDLRMVQNWTEYTNEFNCAGVLINRYVSDTGTTTPTLIDLCLFQTCCNTTAPSVTINSNVNSGPAPLEVAFTSSVTGGTGTITYDWDFGDGGSSTSANPTHTYNTNGNFNAVLTITDSCGWTATSNTIVVEVAAVILSCSLPDDLYLHLSSGDCPDADGVVVHLVRVGATDIWNFSDSTGGAGGCEQADITFAQFDCSTGNVSITFGADNSSGETAPTTFSAGPPVAGTYTLTMGFVFDPTCCDGVITAVLSDSP